jgi:hypothetical protein
MIYFYTPEILTSEARRSERLIVAFGQRIGKPYPSETEAEPLANSRRVLKLSAIQGRTGLSSASNCGFFIIASARKATLPGPPALIAANPTEMKINVSQNG